MPNTLPQILKIVEGMAPATDAAGRTSDYVSLKNYAKAYIVFHVTQGNAATIALTVEQASDVAGTGSTAITATVPIWSNLDTSLTDTLVRRSDAVSYTTDAALKNKMVVFEIDASLLADGFDCICFKTGASHAANLTQGIFLLSEARYMQATPPAAITD